MVEALRSKGYVSDILRKKHNISRNVAILAKAISAHAEQAVNLIEQGLSSQEEVSFLPLYYSMLNLAKVHIIVNGHIDKLQKQKYHGVTTIGKGSVSRDLLSSKIGLKKNGVIPLFYNSITGESLPITRGARTLVIKMDDIYPYIPGISFELLLAYGIKNKYVPIFNGVFLKGDANRYHLSVYSPEQLNLRETKLLKGFKFYRKHENELKPNAYKAKTIYEYKTGSVTGDMKNSRDVLIRRHLRRFLMSVDHHRSDDGLYMNTPKSRKRLLFPIEIPVLLAFYHMSDIVRYNPEHLIKLRDSKDWGILLPLIRQGTISYVESIISEVHRQNIVLTQV
jgi:hypothetical protein